MLTQEQDTARKFIESSFQSEVLMAVNLVSEMKRSAPTTASAALFLADSFGSRGSVMLKAALADRNRQDDRLAAKKVSQEEQRRKLLQQVTESRKSSPGSRVLFSEPVVTNQYEYEQTPFNDNDQEQHSLSDDERAALKKDIRLRRHRIRAARQLAAKQKLQEVAGLNEEEEKFTLASSTFIEMTTSSPKIEKLPNKRSHDSITDEEDIESITSSRTDLFSSPKVAKIAPYYHGNTNDETKETLKEMVLVPNLHKSRRALNPNSVKSNCTRSSQSNRVEKVNSHTSQSANSELLPTETARQDINTELQPNLNQGYLNWLTTGLSYISGQVNKILF